MGESSVPPKMAPPGEEPDAPARYPDAAHRAAPAPGLAAPAAAAPISGYALPPPPLGRPHPQRLWPVAVAFFALGALVALSVACVLGVILVPALRIGLVPPVGRPAVFPAAATPAGVPFDATPVPATLTALSQGASRVYGPRSGQLALRGNGKVAVLDTDLSLRDFIAEVEFMNPYEPRDYGWDYGFIFRRQSLNHEYRLYVTSDSLWSLKHVDAPAPPAGVVPTVSPAVGPTVSPLPASAFKPVAGGVLAHLNQIVSGINRLRLVVSGATGVFFVNDAYVATLDLSGEMPGGELELGSAFLRGNNNPGYPVLYNNLSVWSLDR